MMKHAHIKGKSADTNLRLVTLLLAIPWRSGVRTRVGTYDHVSDFTV